MKTNKESKMEDIQPNKANKQKTINKPEQVFLQRTKTKMENLKNNAISIKSKKQLPSKDKKINVSQKTQGLANKLKQSNIKQIQKQKNTSQNKSSFNLNYLIGNKASSQSNYVEGIIKKTDCVVMPAEKNNGTIIRSNVVGKKSDIKVIANKGVIIFGIVMLILLGVSIVINFIVYSVSKHQLDNPPITITQDMETEIFENQTSFLSITVPRLIVPEITLDQQIDVYTLVINNPILLRAKSVFTSGDGDILIFEPHFTENWTVGNDGYFYYNLPLTTGEHVGAITGITLPNEINLSINGKNQHVITFAFETITQNLSMVQTYWSSCPTEWLDIIF